MRMPISISVYRFFQVCHSLFVILLVWLAQYIILVGGFLLYRTGAPAGLNIDPQLHKIFAPPGLISAFYPLENPEFLTFFILGFIFACLLPSFLCQVNQLGPVSGGIRLFCREIPARWSVSGCFVGSFRIGRLLGPPASAKFRNLWNF